MSVYINLIPRKSVRERVWKTLNVVVGITTILNVSMVGSLIAPKAASAQNLPAETVEVQHTTPPTTVANPKLGESCGLDIGLIVDSSSSISTANMNTMQTALTSFVGSFDGTTSFSLSAFKKRATLLRSFPQTAAEVTSAIGSDLPLPPPTNPTDPNDQYQDGTNWDAALAKGAETLSTDTTSDQNLLVIITDGSPNHYGYPVANNGDVDWSNPIYLNKAIERANSIKNDHVRILVIGVGNDTADPASADTKLNKMKAISGSEVAFTPSAITKDTDVIKVTNFDGIGSALASYAASYCSGKLEVEKIVNGGGSAEPEDFGFRLVGSTGEYFYPKHDQDTVTFSKLTVGRTYPIEETLGSTTGYTQTGNTCASVSIVGGKIVKCAITNTYTPPKGSITVKKFQADGETPLNGATFRVCPHGHDHDCTTITDGVAPDTTADGIVIFNDLATSKDGKSYDVTETAAPVGWIRHHGTHELKLTYASPNKSTSFNNKREMGTVKFEKVTIGGSASDKQYFAFNVNGQQYHDGDSVTLPTDNYTLTETEILSFEHPQALYHLESASGACSLTEGIITLHVDKKEHADDSMVLSSSEGEEHDKDKDKTPVCTITNERNIGVITGNKFNDLNGNGTKDVGEPGVAGVTITLSDGSTMLTDASGDFTFANVPTGTYTVSETVPAGWVATTLTSFTRVVTTEPTAVVYFGNFKTVSISGQKFNDLNGNGVKDIGEAVLSGWTIQLDKSPFGSVDATAVTDINGNYSFPDLGAGTYRVREVLQTGWAQMTVNPTDITAVSGTNISAVNFGNRLLVTSLSITKTNNIVGFTNPGKQATYTITVTNAVAATDSARNIVVTDTLPTGFTFADTGLATKTYPVFDLAPGASKVITDLVNIGATQAIGTYTNTASAKGDNTAIVTATSPVEIRVPSVLGVTAEPSLIVTKTVDTAVTNPGKTVAYTVIISNPGDIDVTNVSLTDTLPKGFVFVDSGKDTKVWNIGTLKARHQRVINYLVKIADDVKAGKYENRATVLSNELDPQTAAATVEVKVPQVLGLASTGASMRDYLTFAFGLGLMSLGLYWIGRLRRRGYDSNLA